MNSKSVWNLRTLLVCILGSIVFETLILFWSGDGAVYNLINFNFRWEYFIGLGSLVIVPIILWCCKAYSGTIYGSLAAFLIFFLGFYCWYLSLDSKGNNGLAGLLYLTSLPSGYVGSFLSAIISYKLDRNYFLISFSISFLGIFIGVFYNLIAH